MKSGDPERDWTALLDAARELLDKRELVAARTVLREAMRYSDKTWGTDDVHLIKPLRLMAESFWREHHPLDRHNEPERGCLQQALTIARRRLPPEHLELARLAGQVGTHLVIAGQFEDGCALMIECIEIADQNGSDNFSQFLQMIAEVRIDQGRPEEALAFIERAASLHEREDPTSVGHAIARYHLGRCLFAVGRHEEALAQLQRALHILDANRARGTHAVLMNEAMDLIERVEREIRGAPSTSTES